MILGLKVYLEDKDQELSIKNYYKMKMRHFKMMDNNGHRIDFNKFLLVWIKYIYRKINYQVKRNYLIII